MERLIETALSRDGLAVDHGQVLDHDAKYGLDVLEVIRSTKMMPLRTSIGCPWQNAVAERWIWRWLPGSIT